MTTRNPTYYDSVSGTLKDMSSGAGDLITTALLPVGSASQEGVLQVDGTTITASGGVISATGGGGSTLVFLQSLTASNSTELDFTSWYSSTYDEYEIHFQNVIPATNAASMLIQFSTNGGSTYDSGTNYTNNFLVWLVNVTSVSTATGQTSCLMQVNASNLANYGMSGKFTLMNTSSGYKGLSGIATAMDGGSGNRTIGWNIANWYTNTTVVNAFRLFMSSGNITSGTVRVYGIKHV